MKILLPLLFSSLLLFGVLALMSPETAAAQSCDLFWDFEDTELPGEWQESWYSWADGWGVDSSGAMRFEFYATRRNSVGRATVLALLGEDTNKVIVSEGITVSLYSRLYSAYIGSARTYLIFSDGSQQMVATSGGGYQEHELTALAGTYFSSLAVEYYLPSGQQYLIADWDNITLHIPCENIVDAPPTPTPTSTPTPTPTGVPTPTITPTPSATPDIIATIVPSTYITYGTWYTGSGIAFIPTPLPISTISETIDMSFMWDFNILGQIPQIMLTFFNLQTIPTFFKIFIPFMVMVIALRAVLHMVGIRLADRSDQQIASGLSSDERARIDAQIAREESRRDSREMEAAYRRSRRR